MERTAVLDLDGTLVDSVYVHVLAWQAAFRDVGKIVPAYRLHRLIGMGGDRLVTEAAGPSTEEAMGDELRERHPKHLDRLFDRIVPTDGAVDLLEELQRQGYRTLLASSSDRALTDRLLGVLEGAERYIERAVTGSDAQESKPSGELIEQTLERAGAQHCVVVGDSVWDVAAAKDAGVPCLGVLTGGLARSELVDAGAVVVHDTPRSLAEQLDRTGLLLPRGP